MRLTDLLHNDRAITKQQYDKLLSQGVKSVMCGRDGWDFSSVNDMDEAEARKWLHNTRLKRTYERMNGIKPLITVFVVHVVRSKDDQQPDWPKELKPYQDKTDNILEAYFCNKFNLPCE